MSRLKRAETVIKVLYNYITDKGFPSTLQITNYSNSHTTRLSPVFSEAEHVLHFVCKIYKCMLLSGDMTAAIRVQKLQHDCYDSRAPGAREGTSIPRVELSKPDFDKQNKGPSVRPREVLVRVGLSLCSPFARVH